MAYDVRVNNSYPVMISERENSHNDRVNAVTFYCSKTNMEFFSGSSAGEIFWWDLRNLEAPIDTLLLDPITMKDGIKNNDKSFGVVQLEYESTIPNKYMVGTENGVVFICNKRFKTPADRIYSKVQCYQGKVSAVQRNPSFLKFFLSVGDWQAKVRLFLIKAFTKASTSFLFSFGARNSKTARYFGPRNTFRS